MADDDQTSSRARVWEVGLYLLGQNLVSWLLSLEHLNSRRLGVRGDSHDHPKPQNRVLGMVMTTPNPKIDDFWVWGFQTLLTPKMT